MSHVDPRMSWGDLVARLVREAVARHDPRGGGRGQRRKGADSAGASPRRAPKETRAAGAAGGPAQRVGEASGRAPNRTGAAGAASGPAQRVDKSSGRGAEPDTCRRGAGGPGSAHRRRYSGTAGQHRRYREAEPDRGAGHRCSTESVGARRAFGWRPCRWRSIGRARRYFGAAVGARGTVGWRPRRRRSIGHVRCYFGAAVGARGHGWMAPALVALHRARPPLLRHRSRRTRHGWMAPVQVALHRARPLLLRHRSRRPWHSWMAPVQVALHRACPPLLRRRSRHLACPLAADRAARQMEQRAGLRRLASLPAQVCRAHRSPLRRRSRHLARPLAADRAARQMEQRAAPRRLASLRAQVCRARRSPLRRRSRCSACAPTADRQTHQPEQRRTRPANLFTAATNPRHGATFPRLSGATSGYATVDAAVIAIRSPGGAAPLPICCRSTTCCQSPRAVARSRPTSISCAQLITECATATDRLLRRSPRCSASCARLARHSTALADSLQVARRGYTSQRREPSVHLRLPPLQTLAGPCRCAHARRCRGLPSTIPAASGVRSHRCIPTLATGGYNSMSRHASHRPTGVSCTTSTEEVRIPGTYHSLLSSLDDWSGSRLA